MQRYGAAFDHDLWAVVRWPWKLVLSDRGPIEVYRLDEDPGERSSRPERPEANALRRALAYELAALGPPVRPARPHELTPELQERLRALGYLR